jgi:hypothetical protein
MPDPIRQQIRTALLAHGTALATALPLRSVELGRDPLVARKPMPNLTLFESDEVEIGKDNRGRTYQFIVTFKFAFEKARNAEMEKDRLVSALEVRIENDLQLGGLANIVDGEDVEFLSGTTTDPIQVVLVSYRVEYRRVRGDPTTKY